MKKKNSIIVLLTLFILLGAVNVFAAPGESVSPLLHVGAGDQITTKLNVGSTSVPGTLFDASESGKNSVFDGSTTSATDANASLFAVLQNGWLQNMIFLGKNTISFNNALLGTPSDISISTQARSNLSLWVSDLLPGPASLIADLQKINIFGGLISTDFDSSTGNITGNMQVCVDSVGSLVQCP